MKRKLFNLLIILVLSLSLSAAAVAQTPAGESGTESYIVIMKQDPVVAYEGDQSGFQATRPGIAGKVDPNNAPVQSYQRYLEAGHNASLAKAGVDVDAKVNDYTVALNGYSALLTAEEVKNIQAQSDVVLVLPDEMRYPTTDRSPKFLGLTVRGGAYDSGYTGEGVVVGVIDTGIWPEHPSFADDGSFPSAPVLDDSRPNCEFGNTAHNSNDAPFTCNNKLIGARQMLDTYRALIGAAPDEFDSARDDDGHGTHTASTAAGNEGIKARVLDIPRGTISGIAPRAHVIAYKGLGNLGGFTSDLAAAIDQAVADGVDVINYSIGGGPSIAGADDIAFLFAADAGVFVATSAGNSGPGAATVGGPGTVPWLTTVGASTQSRTFKGAVKLGNRKWFSGASITSGTAKLPLVDAEFAGGDLCIPGTLNPSVVADKIVLCRRGAIGRAAKSWAVFDAGGAGMIMYENSDDNSLFTDSHWVPSVHVDNTPGLAIKAYIAAAPNPTARIIGGFRWWQRAPTMTYFSSRGPNPVAADIIKPDVTAPGIQILAGHSPFPDPNSTPEGELFQAIAGTSMSSPHVAGIFALLKQAHPEWSAAAAKSALMTTAYQWVRDNDRVSRADPFDMGAGHVDPGGRWNKKGSINRPGLVYDAEFRDYLGFLCDASPEIFVDPEGTCPTLEATGFPTQAINLNLPSIGISELAGSQTIQRTVTSVANRRVRYRAKVKAPPGYDVSVTPNILRLIPGEPATFKVTITNKDAPIGEWRFGSLTWKGLGERGLGYKVYSPIAVKAAAFNAPAEVSGSGTSGSASFDISFGYTGAYTAAAHGLVPATVLSGMIGQDPDQTYPSGDDAPGPAGGVDKFPIPLAGSAYLRIALSIPGPDDIDLFLEDSGGTRIATSTGGGTNELIELELPADDTYTLVVHGWSVPSAPLAYAVDTWSVPLATGGSLSIVSAPASAVLGTTGTVDISWSGLSSGTQYLGAVSHSDSSGLIGLTLVDVDVP